MHQLGPEPVFTRKMTRSVGGLWFAIVSVIALFAGGVIAIALQSAGELSPHILAVMAILAVIGLFFVVSLVFGLARFSRVPDQALNNIDIDNISFPILLTDANGRPISANRSYLAITEDLTGQLGPETLEEMDDIAIARRRVPLLTIERLFSDRPDVAESVYRIWMKLKTGLGANEAIRLGNKNDDLGDGWLDLTATPVLDDNNVLQGVVWMMVDMEDGPQEIDALYRDLQITVDSLDHLPAGFFSTDVDGQILYMNATLANWLDYDLEQLGSNYPTLSDIIAGDGSVLFKPASGAGAENNVHSFDIDFKTSRQQLLPVHVMHQVHYSANGTAGASRTLVFKDAVNALHNETNARAAELRFSRFFNTAPIAMALLNKRFEVVRANVAFHKLFEDGLAQREGEDISLTQLIADDFSEDVTTFLRDTLSGASQGGHLDVNITGQSDRSIQIFSNIASDQNKDVSSLEPGDEALLVFISETTEQRILEQQFAQGQKMQAIGQLAGGVAHDFNNVLTAIIGHTDLLLATIKPTDSSARDLKLIKQNANRAANLVKQLLAFSRRQTLQPKVMQISEHINELSVLLKRLLGEGIRLHVDQENELWYVKVDGTQFEQVVINLAVNARDAMPNGGDLTIRTRNASAAEIKDAALRGLVPEDSVIIEVEDTGTGMPESVLKKIFDPFFSTKDIGKGTGLGLSTVYGIIKQTGGYIYADSTIGVGTRFTIILPRHIPTEEEKPQLVKSEPQAPKQDLTGSETVLLVEDEETVRAFAERALKQRGYTVVAASNGFDALEHFEDPNFVVDLVVSDVMMPEMNGPTLLKRVRELRPDTKFIFVSGYAEDAFEDHLSGHEGHFTFLAKPFSLRQLAETVKDVLSGKIQAN